MYRDKPCIKCGEHDFYRPSPSRPLECRECPRKTSTAYYYRNRGSVLATRNYRYKQDPRGSLISDAKRRAKEKNRKFSITKADIFLPRTCPILGLFLKPSKTGKVAPNSSSIDRIDSTGGYVRENVRVISHKANTIKSNATPDDLYCVYVDSQKNQMFRKGMYHI